MPKTYIVPIIESLDGREFQTPVLICTDTLQPVLSAVLAGWHGEADEAVPDGLGGYSFPFEESAPHIKAGLVREIPLSEFNVLRLHLHRYGDEIPPLPTSTFFLAAADSSATNFFAVSATTYAAAEYALRAHLPAGATIKEVPDGVADSYNGVALLAGVDLHSLCACVAA